MPKWCTTTASTSTTIISPVLSLWNTVATQLDALKSTQNYDAEEGEVENVRPIQSMNGRKLLLNKAGKVFIEEDTMTKMLLIFGTLVLVMLVPPLVILWVIYKKTTIANLQMDRA
ncbi:unnamed protein product, partial [Strongylus vulgaris]